MWLQVCYSEPVDHVLLSFKESLLNIIGFFANTEQGADKTTNRLKRLLSLEEWYAATLSLHSIRARARNDAPWRADQPCVPVCLACSAHWCGQGRHGS